MAIIPAEEKVFMVSNSTNTTYSGSAALKAMQKWYTMQDVIDSVSVGGAPTLQQVVDAGNTATQTIIVSIEDYGNGIEVSSGEGVGVQGSSTNGYGVYGTSVNRAGVYGYSDTVSAVLGESPFGTGVNGYSSEGIGGYFSSNSGLGLYGESVFGNGVQGVSEEGYGGFFSTNTGPYSLVANESAAKPGGGSWSVFSDSRIKENIIPYTKGLADILLINTVTYDYNGLAGTTKGAKYTGVIAQEMKEIFPETVSTYKAKLNEEDEEKTELYDFNSSDLTFALINAIKELNEKIKILEAK